MKEFPAVSEMRGMLFVVLTVGVIFPMTPVSEVVFFLGFISFLDMVPGSFESTTSEAVLFSEAHQEYGASGYIGVKLWSCVLLGMAIGRVFLGL